MSFRTSDGLSAPLATILVAASLVLGGWFARPAEAAVAPGGPDLEALAIPRTPGGATPRSAESTDAASLFADLDALGRAGDWYLGYNNENGILAWGESFVMAAHLEMYGATGETAHLDEFVRHADGVLAQTDEVRDVSDWAGRSGPVWRSGSRYNYGSLVATGTDGDPMGVLTATSRLYNDSTLAEIRTGKRPGTFYMAFRNAKYRRAEGYDALDTDPASPDYWVRRINERSTLVNAVPLRAWGDRTRPASMDRRPFQHSYVVHAVHSGLVAYPLARFARVVSEEASLAPAYGAAAARYLAAAGRAVSFHDEEYVDSARSGYYRFEPGAPLWCDGVGVPHNQNLAMARAMVELYRVTGDWGRRARAEKLALRLKNELVFTDRLAYVWRYWWGPGLRGWQPHNSPSINTVRYGGHRAYEDIMHGAHDIDTVADAAEAGIVFEDRDVARMANTLLLNMRDGADFHTRVDGSTLGSPLRDVSRAARWMALARVSKDVYDATTPGLAEALIGGETYGFELYTAALLARVEAGYAAEATETGRAAGRAPAVTLIAPTGGRVGGRLEVRAAVATGAITSALLVGRRDLGAPAVLRTGSAAWSLDTRVLHDGRADLEVVSADASDRARSTRTRVYVDNTAPRVGWYGAPVSLTPNGDGDAEGAWWVFGASEWGGRTLAVTDSRRRVVAVPLRDVRRAAGKVGARFDARDGFARPLAEGRYLVRAFASDAVGNVKALPPRPLLVSRLARWKVPATRRLPVWETLRVPVNLRRAAVVSAGLYRGSRRVASVRPAAPARAGWLVLRVPRTVGPRRLPRGVYALRVDARDRLGAVTLTRALEMR